jgi:hypothetical protein
MTTDARTFPTTPSAARPWLTLGRVMAFDALTCLAMGIALAAFAQHLAGPLGLPAPLLLWAGVILFPSALAMAAAALWPHRALVRLVVVGNVLWVMASIAVVATGDPTALGGAFVIAQAAAVAVLAWLEAQLSRSAAA